MGIYVNPGNISFQEAINSKTYVDKSGRIPYTNSVIRTRRLLEKEEKRACLYSVRPLVSVIPIV